MIEGERWWYIRMPYAVGAISVVDGRVARTPPIFRWMVGMRWLECKATIMSKGGHGEPMTNARS